MKNTRKSKLALHTETIKRLTATDLRRVDGGSSEQSRGATDCSEGICLTNP